MSRVDRLDEPYLVQAIGLAAGSALLSDPSERARGAVARYVTRMGGRATPFGLFAGTALVGTGAERRLTLADRTAHRAFVRPDLAALEAVLVASGLADSTSELIQPGREPMAIAAELLRQHGDADSAAALERLVSVVCGPRPVAEVSSVGLGAAWQEAEAALPALSGVREKARYHVDLDLSMAEGQIERGLARELDLVLRKLQPAFPEQDGLADFKKAFRGRYEDAEVPLNEVLDFRRGLIETSFTATSRLAQSARVESLGAKRGDRRVPETALRAYDHWRATGRPFDIGALPAAEAGTAGSVQAALLDDHEGRFDALLLGGQRRAPLAYLARFMLSRPEREQALRGWSTVNGPEEDAHEAITAELVYTPGGRIGNVLLRPRLHRQRIGLSGRQGDGELDPASILVSLVGDRFVLSDADTRRPVVLELNSAHAVDLPGTDPSYRLLAHLSGVGKVGWTWGGLAGLSHLPRVTCGRIIVRPERWRLGAADVERIAEARDPALELRKQLPDLGDRRWIGCGSTDRLLPVDLDSPDSVTAVLKRAVRSGAVDFTELPHVESPAVAGPGGRHVAEVYLPLRGGPSRPERAPAAYHGAPGLGADWVYAKYYCGVATADAVVLRASACAGLLRADDRVSEWFFVRYGEGGNHVRVRLRPTGPGQRHAVLAALDDLGRELKAEGLATRAVMDDYVPEVSRYGGPGGLRQAEKLFSADSDRTAGFIAGGPTEESRLFQAVGDILHWAEVFLGDGTTPADDGDGTTRDDAEVIEVLRGRDDRRTGPGPRMGSRYGDYYRARRAALDEYLVSYRPCPTTVSALRGLRQELDSCDGASRSSGREAVFRAVLHMHCNRLFALDAPRLERLAYDLAIRRLLERRARAGQQISGSTSKDG